jgi:glycosyltransferase involved in cell wall biosynthesis
LLYKAGDVAELGAAMARLLDDEQLRLTMTDAAFRTVEARYRPARMIEIIEGVYDELLAEAA